MSWKKFLLIFTPFVLQLLLEISPKGEISDSAASAEIDAFHKNIELSLTRAGFKKVE